MRTSSEHQFCFRLPCMPAVCECWVCVCVAACALCTTAHSSHISMRFSLLCLPVATFSLFASLLFFNSVSKPNEYLYIQIAVIENLWWGILSAILYFFPIVCVSVCVWVNALFGNSCKLYCTSTFTYCINTHTFSDKCVRKKEVKSGYRYTIYSI